ncbi:MAG: MMPL family transporter [Planctomycetes bacterium]|nr:MMPL family transporter [Planctomycetota bacterium]
MRLLLLSLRHPRAALALVAVASALAVLPLVCPGSLSRLAGRPVGLRSDFGVRSLFPTRDPRLATYDAFMEDFGRDDATAMVLLTREAGSVLERPYLERVHALTEALRRLPRVDGERVLSLSHVTWVRSEGDTLQLAPLFEPGRASDGELANYRERLPANPLYRDRVVSADASTAAFLVPLHKAHDTESNRDAFAQEVRAWFEARLVPGETLHVDGLVTTRNEIRGHMRRDARVYYPVAFALLVAILAWVLGSLRGGAAATLVVALSVLWTLGGMALLDVPLNLISTAIPVILCVVCVGDSVHLIHCCRTLRASGAPGREAVERALPEVGLACLLTSVTTAAGFGSMAASDVPMVRDFGLPVALGTMAAYAATFLVLPPLLARWPALVEARPGAAHGLTERLARLAVRLGEPRPWRVLAAAALVALPAVAVLGRLRVESRMLGDFGPETRLVQTREFVEARFGGVSALQVVLRGQRPGGALDLAALRAVDGLVAELRGTAFREAGVLHVLALTDYLKDMHHILHERAPGTEVLPATPEAVAQYLFLYEGAEPSDPTLDLVSARRDATRVVVRVRNLYTPAFFDLVRRVAEAAGRRLPPDLRLEITGATLMGQAVHQSLVRNLLYSLALALVVVTASFLALARSVTVALASLIPNLLPLLFILAGMAACGVALEVVSSLVFCVTFGIAVDDTLHLIAAVRQRREAGAEAVWLTLEEVGPALIQTTVILAGGFSVLLLSTIHANRVFGGACVLTLILALAADLTVTPALLAILSRRRAPAGADSVS